MQEFILKLDFSTRIKITLPSEEASSFCYTLGLVKKGVRKREERSLEITRLVGLLQNEFTKSATKNRAGS